MLAPSELHNSPAARSSDEGYLQAVQLLRDCMREHGFLASLTEKDNYRRVWSRDGAIIGLAALMTQDEPLRQGTRKTLETLAAYQGPHGEIPSNVDPESGRVSYGGTAGRIDGNLWFIICCGEYVHATGDTEFLARFAPLLARTRWLLGAWEFNNRGLLYVPQTGDWADEYLHSGYVLFDQLLYYQAQRTIEALKARYPRTGLQEIPAESKLLGKLIRANYWLAGESESTPQDVYHEVLHRKGRGAAGHRDGEYWMPSFAPTGYAYRFDAFANVLVSLMGLADDGQRHAVDKYIAEIVPPELPLLPAFHPVIEPRDEDWDDLQMTFSYSFKNAPFEYHNGGLWPLITGFHAADLALRGKRAEAQRYLEALDRANALEMEGQPWSFPEFVHGKELTAAGTRGQCWSAAAAVIARHALKGAPVFGVTADE